jgi:hypothetical protein
MAGCPGIAFTGRSFSNAGRPSLRFKNSTFLLFLPNASNLDNSLALAQHPPNDVVSHLARNARPALKLIRQDLVSLHLLVG